ncbi:MAG: hypothetical protein CBD97_02345 [Pelagibacteraceae bacterium TMED237]|nr:MAG: hypothetical protein CBD97_02345 [Pelagibacteraceae bacterium TMED237]
MTKILIIGLGKIGFYHFDSLFKSKNYFQIDCVEISENRINQINNYIKKSKGNEKVRIYKSLNMIDKYYDFLIHATNSDVRLITLQKILSISKIKYCILEKNLSGSLIELKKFKHIQKRFKKCWVNTFRHESTLWQKFKKKVSVKNIFLIEFRGIEGLACNAIHNIDLIASWKKKLPLSVEITNLQKWYKSKKRKGFVDFCGEIEVIFPDNLRLLIRGYEGHQNLKCNIFEKKQKWTLLESAGMFFSKNEKITGTFEYQSVMTNKLINKIIKTGKCDLPELNWSIDCYTILLEALLKNWNQCFETSVKKISIT